MATLERAIEIAARAHAGQVDKGGYPYILHPLRVMLSVDTTHQRIAAVLHDVVEDTAITLADLSAEGFPSAVIDAIFALTKTAGEGRIAAAHRAAANPIARVVKLADVADNMNLARIPNPTEKDFARLKEYEQVRAILLQGVPL
jgi:GTP diphosphokinase / guanosine-3',5'-bis(diphosphate) 3'-diphosphatase